MAIFDGNYKDEDEKAFMHDMQPEIEKGCFLCGEPVGATFIFWSSPIAFMVLHPDCAANFTLALSRDLHEIKRATGKRLSFIN